MKHEAKKCKIANIWRGVSREATGVFESGFLHPECGVQLRTPRGGLEMAPNPEMALLDTFSLAEFY